MLPEGHLEAEARVVGRARPAGEQDESAQPGGRLRGQVRAHHGAEREAEQVEVARAGVVDRRPHLPGQGVDRERRAVVGGVARAREIDGDHAPPAVLAATERLDEVAPAERAAATGAMHEHEVGVRAAAC